MENNKSFWFESLEVFPMLENTKSKTKPTIMMIHGFATDHRCFRYFEIFLKKQKYNFYTFNLPGSSSLKKYPVKHLGIKGMADLIIKFIKSHNLSNLLIIGHSMGGAIAGIVTANLPSQVKGLIMLSPLNKTSFPKIISKADKFYPKNYKDFMRLQKEIFVNPEETLELIDREEYYEQTILMFKNNFKFFFITMLDIAAIPTIISIDSNYKKIKTKTLILLGEKDRFISVHRSKKYFSLVIDEVEIRIIQSTGHGFFIEKEEYFFEQIMNYIKELETNE